MTTPTTLTTTQLMWLCALYGRECPACHGTIINCHHCNGTGRVPLLEGVREPCPNAALWPGRHDGMTHDYAWGKGTLVNEPVCTRCHSLGWTPTEDVWKWLAHAEYYYILEGPWPSKIVNEAIDHRMRKVMGDRIVEDFKRSFFESVEQALRPLAINAAEAQEWVKRNIA